MGARPCKADLCGHAGNCVLSEIRTCKDLLLPVTFFQKPINRLSWIDLFRFLLRGFPDRRPGLKAGTLVPALSDAYFFLGESLCVRQRISRGLPGRPAGERRIKNFLVLGPGGFSV